MLNRRTTTINKYKRQISTNHNICLPLITGSRNKSSVLPPPTLINNTDAILFGANKRLVSQPRISPRKAQNPYNRTTVPTDSSQLKLVVRQDRHNNTPSLSLLLSSSFTYRQQQQPVKSKANKIITIAERNHCSNKQGYPKAMKALKMMNLIYYISALLLLTLCALTTSTQFIVSADSALQSKMQTLKISPDIINVPSSVSTIRVELHGNIVKPGDPVPAKHFKGLDVNKIQWDVNNYDARHTVLLLDLDRKPGPNSTQNIYNQYTSLNIPGNIINAGQVIVAFDTPIVPCQPNAKHRILMLALHQAQNIDISDVAYMSASSGQSSKRENFKLEDFIIRHRLELVAANVFLAIGETNGVCSGAATIHSIQSLSSILIAMVIAIAAYAFSNRHSIVN